MIAKGSTASLRMQPATAHAPQRVVVNNRNLGAAGSMSQGFCTTNTINIRDKVQLKNMIVKANQAGYCTNPLEQRRLQQQINKKAQHVYGAGSRETTIINQSVRQSMVSATTNPGVRQTNTGSFGAALNSKINQK